MCCCESRQTPRLLNACPNIDGTEGRSGLCRKECFGRIRGGMGVTKGITGVDSKTVQEAKKYSGQKMESLYTKVGHQTRDCRAAIAPNTQRALVRNQQGIIYYECGKLEFRKDCPKLRNQNCGNQTGNKNGNKTGNQTGGNETTARAYAIDGGGTNPDSNVVTDTSFAIELVDGKNFRETNIFDVSHCGSKLNIISCTEGPKKYLRMDGKLIWHQFSPKSGGLSRGRGDFADVPHSRDFPEVFSQKTLPGLTAARQVEFQIDYCPWCCTCSTSTYRLAPAEMQELFNSVATKCSD
ncbi:hypothetical protein Tco_1292773 [Tanacetum coccineum]